MRSILLFLLFLPVLGYAQKMEFSIPDFEHKGDILTQWGDKIGEETGGDVLASEIKEFLITQGYVSARVSISEQKEVVKVEVNPGQKFTIARIYWKNIPDTFIRKYGKRLSNGQPFNPLLLEAIYEEVLDYFEMQGYPFASIGLTDIQWMGNALTGTITVDEGMDGNIVRIETVDTELSSKWLKKLAGLEAGVSYNRTHWEELRIKLSRVGLTPIAEPTFREDSSGVVMVIVLPEAEKGSADGLVGLQTGDGRERVSVTGYLTLDVQNLFRRAKQLQLDWQRFAPGSQFLEGYFSNPLMLGYTVQLEGRMQMIWFNNDFFSRTMDLNMGFFPANAWKMGLLAQWWGSNNLNEEASMEAELSSIDSRSFGGGFSLGYQGKTFRSNMRVVYGKSSIIRDATLPVELYSGIPESVNQWRLLWRGDWNKTMGKKWQWVQSSQAETLLSPVMFDNYRFPLGGLGTIRGFSERSFLADQYILLRTELRYRFETGSYFYVFTDHAILETETGVDYPSSVGLGLHAELNKNAALQLIWGNGNIWNRANSTWESAIQVGFISKF